jgi:anti-sigma factor RsiW
MTVKNKEAGAVEPVSDYLIERLVAGDLSAERAAEVQARLAAEPDGQARIAQLRASNEEILRAHPPAEVAEQIRRRAARPAAVRAPRWLSLGVPMTLAAAFALVLVVRGTTGPGHAGADDVYERIKGAPSLRVYRKAAAGRVERLQDGATTRSGDQLQLSYLASGRRFGAVLSVDGAGQVTFHLPAVAGPAVQLNSHGETALASSYELDAAPGFERFLFVTSDEPFDAAALADVARGHTPPPAGKYTVFFTVRKP